MVTARPADSESLAHCKQLVADAGWTPSPESWEDLQMHFVEAFSTETQPGTGPRRVLPAYRVRYWTLESRYDITGNPKPKGAASK